MRIDIKDVFIGRAQKYNHFDDAGVETAGRDCRSCVRKQFSYPYTCDDGWTFYRASEENKGARCRNWTDQGNAKVD